MDPSEILIEGDFVVNKIKKTTKIIPSPEEKWVTISPIDYYPTISKILGKEVDEYDEISVPIDVFEEIKTLHLELKDRARHSATYHEKIRGNRLWKKIVKDPLAFPEDE